MLLPFSGNWLSSKSVTSRLPSIVYVVILVVIYIYNIFTTQQLHRQILYKGREISVLSVTSNTIHSAYVTYTKESNIINEINKRKIPLFEIVQPPTTFNIED